MADVLELINNSTHARCNLARVYHGVYDVIQSNATGVIRTSFTAVKTAIDHTRNEIPPRLSTLINGCFIYQVLHRMALAAMLWRCWLGVRKSIRPVDIEWWGVGVVVCLERGADCLHVVQLMPLPSQTPSSLASFKSRLVLPFCTGLPRLS